MEDNGFTSIIAKQKQTFDISLSFKNEPGKATINDGVLTGSALTNSNKNANMANKINPKTKIMAKPHLKNEIGLVCMQQDQNMRNL